MSEIKPGAIHQMSGGRRVQVGVSPDGKVVRNWNGRVAVRNVVTGRLSYVKDDDLLRATPAPVAACVWADKTMDRTGRLFSAGCRDMQESKWHMAGWKWCPYCGKQFRVAEDFTQKQGADR